MKPKKFEVKAILFDYGNVLVVDTAEILEEMFGYKKLPAVKKERYDRAWHMVETGKAPKRFLLEVIKETFGFSYSLAEIEEFYLDTVAIEPMWTVLKELRKKYRIGILTNNLDAWPEKEAKKLGKSLSGIKLFNSAKIGFHKPDLGIYKFAIKNLGLKAEEIVFIDDKQKNVDAANKAGMKGIQFDGNITKLLANLKKYAVEVRISSK